MLFTAFNLQIFIQQIVRCEHIQRTYSLRNMPYNHTRIDNCTKFEQKRVACCGSCQRSKKREETRTPPYIGESYENTITYSTRTHSNKIFLTFQHRAKVFFSFLLLSFDLDKYIRSCKWAKCKKTICKHKIRAAIIREIDFVHSAYE